jgi:amidase
VDPEVAAICRAAAARFGEIGVVVEEAHPDLSEAHDTFQVMRGMAFATSYAGLLEHHRDKMKPEVVWNIEKGLSYSMEDVVRAENNRAAMFRRMSAFFDTYDLLLCPATIVAAYPASAAVREGLCWLHLLELCRVAGDCVRDHSDDFAGA